MKTIARSTVAEELNRNPLTAEVFKQFGIDYCCQGDLLVKTAAEKAVANFENLGKELDRIASLSDTEVIISNQEINFIIDHIVAKHHDFIRETVPVIVYYAARVAQKHSETFPELIQVQRLFSKAVKQLEKQLEFEESILFPYLREILKAKQEGKILEPTAMAPLENQIKQIKLENRETAYVFKGIAELTKNFSLPTDVRNPFRVLYQQLEAFENDLFLHLHLKNNVLFPKAIELEREVVRLH